MRKRLVFAADCWPVDEHQQLHRFAPLQHLPVLLLSLDDLEGPATDGVAFQLARHLLKTHYPRNAEKTITLVGVRTPLLFEQVRKPCWLDLNSHGELVPLWPADRDLLLCVTLGSNHDYWWWLMGNPVLF